MLSALFAAGLVLGLAAGSVLRASLARRSYRYADELDLPARPTAWVIPAVGLAVALVLAGQWRHSPLLAVGLALAVPPLVGLAAIDLDTRRLPDRWTRPLTAYAALLLIVVALAGDGGSARRGALAALVLGGSYLVLVLAGAGTGMGLGDAKLAVPLGAFLGVLGWSHVLLATLLAFLLGAMQALWLLLVRRAGRKATLAFGPYLIGGTLLVLAAPVLSLGG